MLIEEIENVDIEYELFYSIIEAIYKNINIKESIKQYCYKMKNDRITYFDNHIYILIKLKIIEMNNYEYTLTGNSYKYLKDKEKFIVLFLKTLIQEEILNNFDNIIKKINNKYYISNSDIPLKYSGLRNFLISNNILKTVNNNIFKINEKYIKYFDFNKELSLQNLKNLLIIEEEQGKVAEEFVIKFEKNRTNCDKEIIQMSIENTLAGYDIRSVLSKNNKETIYIEVKSYKNDKIYITKNEINTSKKYGEKYYIYLVDINKIKDKDYIPTIIKNPYNNIILNSKINKTEELISVKIKEIEESED